MDNRHPRTPEQKAAYNDGWYDARSGQDLVRTYAFALVGWYWRGQYDAKLLVDVLAEVK